MHVIFENGLREPPLNMFSEVTCRADTAGPANYNQELCIATAVVPFRAKFSQGLAGKESERL